MKIDSFEDEFHFLSNFHDSPFIHDGIVYPTNEHFYQAMKSLSRKERKRIAALKSAGTAKREGRRLDVRADWESVKIDVMREGLRLKFVEGSKLAEMLLATESASLIEGNTWGDKYWGVDISSGVGQNWLGKLLMERRNELRQRKSET